MAPHSVPTPPESVDTTQHTIKYSAALHAELQPKAKIKAPLRTIFPPLELEEHPIDEAPPISAIVVGAGIAGINAGILLPRKVPGLNLKIYEKSSDVVSDKFSLFLQDHHAHVLDIGRGLEHKYLSRGQM